MNYWLLKSDPDTYGYDELLREKRTVWDGVRNNQALIFIREMKRGDQVLIYHSCSDRCVVGLAQIVRGPYPDPNAENERFVVVDLKVGKPLPSPVPLADIKADPAFADFHLVRISRLSVMPVPFKLWKKLLSMGDYSSGS